MNAITITVCDERKTFSYDLEVPVMQTMDSLGQDILDVLEGCNQAIKKSNVTFFVPRLKRIINSYETSNPKCSKNKGQVTQNLIFAKYFNLCD